MTSTCWTHPIARPFLYSAAYRGEAALLFILQARKPGWGLTEQYNPREQPTCTMSTLHKNILCRFNGVEVVVVPTGRWYPREGGTYGRVVPTGGW